MSHFANTDGLFTYPEPETQICPNCGIDKDYWKEGSGHGYEKNDVIFCCKRCAELTGCSCGDLVVLPKLPRFL